MSHDFRDDFPMLTSDKIYFDSAATAFKPKPVIKALNDYYEKETSTVHRAVYRLAATNSSNYSSVREKVAKFIGAPCSNEIIFTRGTTEAINLVATCFGKAFIQPGDEILLSEIEHHSNLVPWQIMAEERGALLKFIPVLDSGDLDLDAFYKLLSPKTKLLAIAHISNVLGTLHPVKEMIAAAKEKGAKVLLDGAQAITQLKVNVRDLDCDFYAFSGHKLFGPTGVGVLYGKKELLEKMPPFLGGGDMIDRVTLEKTTYQPIPLKFEAGTPSIAEVLGLGAAIDYVQAIGMEEIEKRDQELLHYATEKLKSIPDLRIIGQAKKKGGIISFVVDGRHPLDIGTFLDFKGISVRTGHQCAQTAMQRFGISACVRVSFAFYNTKEEIDRFHSSLNEVLSVSLAKTSC